MFVHLNYLLLRGLKTYYMDDDVKLADRARKLYASVKSKVMETVFD